MIFRLKLIKVNLGSRYSNSKKNYVNPWNKFNMHSNSSSLTFSLWVQVTFNSEEWVKKYKP